MVYEYYDGYEFEDNRPKVQYFVLGETDSGHVAICYVGDYNFVAKIGKRTHSRAWEKGTISVSEAICFMKNSLREFVESVDEEIEQILQNKEALDKEHACLPGHSASCSSGVSLNFSYKHGESYSEKRIEALMAKRNLLSIRDKYLDKLIQMRCDNQHKLDLYNIA